jgi:hypothetical protein
MLVIILLKAAVFQDTTLYRLVITWNVEENVAPIFRVEDGDSIFRESPNVKTIENKFLHAMPHYVFFYYILVEIIHSFTII